MLKNVGTAERIGRAGLGVILALVGISSGGLAMWILLAVAAVLLVTAAISYCPIHRMFGISTVGNVMGRPGQT